MKKIFDPTRYDTDKQMYWKNYDQFFQYLAGREIALLELGIDKGGSLQLWHDYFENAIIVGLDIKPVHIENSTGRIHVYQGFQHDTDLLDRIALETAPCGFDVIIDDASHIGDLTRISFWHLFDNWLKPGGLYVIEDWGTGYWDDWLDGSGYRPRSTFCLESITDAILRKLGKESRKTRLRRNLSQVFLKIRKWLWFFGRAGHNFGMVGFIKELVDECAMGDITDPNHGKPPYRPSKFEKIQIVPGQVFIIKSNMAKKE
jgi:hypothetical protein